MLAALGGKEQALIIQRMVRDLNVPVEIVTSALVREPDNLAMSSRNRYLSPDERKRALSLSRGILAAEAAWKAGERDAQALIGIVRRSVEEGQGKIDYIVLNSQDTLEPLAKADRPALLAAAVYFGTTRLIDNVFLG